MAEVGELVLDAAVVEHLAARDGLSPEEARARALDTLRLVAAGREHHARRAADPGPVLTPRRAEHLRRAALARLWLTERFEPAHGPQDIPDDDRRLTAARADPRMVHPEVHGLCQVVVEPPNVTDEDQMAAITADPAWREAASQALAPVLARIDRNVPVDDHEACRLMKREVELSGPGDDPRLHITFPRPGGFELRACEEHDDAGACTKPRFAPAWTREIERLAVPGRSVPFFTPAGLHVVQVEQRLPAQLADDPATDRIVREAVLDPWRADQLGQRLEELRRQRTVRVAGMPEDGG